MIEEIKQYDKEFNEAMFLTKVDHIFIMILDAIMSNDMSSVKHYLADDIYNKYQELVKEYSEKGLTRLFDEMNVKSTSLNSYNVLNNTLNINVTIESRYMDYFINDDGDYVSGVNTHRIEKSHNIVFSKKLDSNSLKEARRCNHCGKTIDINDSGVCPYCNQVIDISDREYIVTSIDLL